MSRTLTTADIESAAASLGLEPCAVRAVIAVESAGGGFLPDGRVKILFEGHVFWKELKKRGIDPAEYVEEYGFSDVLYPKWGRSKYKGGAGEYDRLNKALGIHKEAALCSASYGLFQIMGFNHKLCGFADVNSFYEAQKQGEKQQLDAFCEFMRSEGLILFLKGRDWAGFALRYNGPGYAQNQYDTKLRQAYERCLKG